MLGDKIKKARKDKKISGDELGKLINITKGQVSLIENGHVQKIDPALVARIAEALGDDTILYAYLQDNPVYQKIIPKIFPDLNNIRRDQAIIFTRIAQEMEEGRDAARVLAEVFSNAEPESTPCFEGVFTAQMEQIVDVKRAIEILEFQLVALNVCNAEGLRHIYKLQQRKCEAHGHHKPDKEESAA